MTRASSISSRTALATVLLAITRSETIMTQMPDNQLDMRAFEKLMWIQNDFINRHYQS